MFDTFISDVFLPCLPIVVFFAGGYLALKLRVFSPLSIRSCFLSLFGKRNRSGVSPFAALTVALAGTLGVGNIAGVAVAISTGGCGAVLWMWVSALFSLSLKYAEVILAVKYRKIENASEGDMSPRICGGPMYYILYGLKSKPLACAFCFLCIVSSLCSGCVIQSNSAAVSMNRTFGVPFCITGLILGILCGFVVFSGIKVISRFTSVAVPAISLAFFVLSLTAVIMSADKLPFVFSEIFRSAFGIRQMSSGVCGFAIAKAIKQGVVKSSLSHEAGAGTSAISHACANTKSPVEQGFLGIFEVLIDTVVMCTVTALVILCAFPQESIVGSNGVDITARAYGVFFGACGDGMISASVLLFAFAAIICQAYYGVACVEFLTKSKHWRSFYILAYCVCTVAGSVITLEFMWCLTDLFTCCMIFLNVYAVMRLRGEAEYEVVKYHSVTKRNTLR